MSGEKTTRTKDETSSHQEQVRILNEVLAEFELNEKLEREKLEDFKRTMEKLYQMEAFEE